MSESLADRLEKWASDNAHPMKYKPIMEFAAEVEALEKRCAELEAAREDASRRLSRAIEWQRDAVVVLRGFRAIAQGLGKPHDLIDALIAEAEGEG